MVSSRGLKRNLKIELDHYDEDGRYHGLKTHQPQRRRDGPDPAPRGAGLRRLPRGRRPRPANGLRGSHPDRARQVRQGVPRPLHPHRAGGPDLPQGSLQERQGPAAEAGAGSRPRVPRRGLGTGTRHATGPSTRRPSSRPSRFIDFVRLVNRGRRRAVPQGDRLVPRRGRVPALRRRQRLAGRTSTASSRSATTITST